METPINCPQSALGWHFQVPPGQSSPWNGLHQGWAEEGPELPLPDMDAPTLCGLRRWPSRVGRAGISNLLSAEGVPGPRPCNQSAHSPSLHHLVMRRLPLSPCHRSGQQDSLVQRLAPGHTGSDSIHCSAARAPQYLASRWTDRWTQGPEKASFVCGVSTHPDPMQGPCDPGRLSAWLWGWWRPIWGRSLLNRQGGRRVPAELCSLETWVSAQLARPGQLLHAEGAPPPQTPPGHQGPGLPAAGMSVFLLWPVDCGLPAPVPLTHLHHGCYMCHCPPEPPTCHRPQAGLLLPLRPAPPLTPRSWSTSMAGQAEPGWLTSLCVGDTLVSFCAGLWHPLSP